MSHDEQAQEHGYEQIMHTACSRFDLGSWSGQLDRLSGSFNETFRFSTDRGMYVIRLLNPSTSIPRLEELQSVIMHLNEEGLPVPLPFLTQENTCFSIIDERVVQVAPNLPGRRFHCHSEQVHASGQMLKRLHRTLLGRKLDLKPAHSFYPTQDYYTEAIKQLQRLDGIPASELDQVACYAERIEQYWNSMGKLPSTLIHGDWHFWNQLYTKHDISAVLDFDYMEEGIRIHDVAYALWCIYILLPRYQDTLDVAFLEGYGMLTSEERELLPAAVARISLFFLLHAATSSDSLEKWEKQVQRQLPLLAWLQGEGGKRISTFNPNHDEKSR